jgi:hypothetical protein
VADLAHLDPAFEKMAPRSLNIRDDEIDVAHRAYRRVGQSATNLNGTVRARGRELNDAKPFLWRIVDVQREADLIDVKSQSSLNVGDRERNNFD